MMGKLFDYLIYRHVSREELRKEQMMALRAPYAMVAEAQLAAALEELRKARTENTKLREALTKLSNEVLASLPLMEPLARREFGNTNYAILIQRAEEARALTGD